MTTLSEVSPNAYYHLSLKFTCHGIPLVPPSDIAQSGSYKLIIVIIIFALDSPARAFLYLHSAPEHASTFSLDSFYSFAWVGISCEFPSPICWHPGVCRNERICWMQFRLIADFDTTSIRELPAPSSQTLQIRQILYVYPYSNSAVIEPPARDVLGARILCITCVSAVVLRAIHSWVCLVHSNLTSRSGCPFNRV